MPLPGQGTLSYNGVTFDSLTRTKITGTPVLDEARRTTKWLAWTLEVEGYLSDAASTDATMSTRRQALTKCGQELRYTEKGFGELWVNNGRVEDANWGPIPELLSWDPVGSNRSCFVVWRVTTHIPECEGARYQGLAAFNYEVDFEIDKDAYTSRTISGFLEIAQTRDRGFGNRVKRTADGYRDLVRPLPLEGFEREVQRFKVSKSKNRLDFTFVDRQRPVPLPPGVSSADIEHTVSSSLRDGFQMWTHRLGGPVTVPAGAPRGSAWDKFLLIVASRVLNQRAAKLPEHVRDTRLLLDSVTFSEQVTGRASRFEVVYRQLGTPLEVILEASGLWRPINGTSFVIWQKSLLESVLHERGSARLVLPDLEETIVDLCTRTEPKPAGGRPQKPVREPPVRDRVKEPDRVDPRHSWLVYDNRLHLITADRKARHHLLPADADGGLGPDFAPRTRTDPLADFAVQSSEKAQPALPEPHNGVDDVVQTVGRPRYTIVMYGRAARLEHKPPVPALLKVGGVPVEQINRQVWGGILGAVGGVPIHDYGWQIIYVLPRKFEGVMPDLANPAYGLDGG